MNLEERNELRHQYEEQKELEKYQKERVLHIPKTNKVMLCGCFFLFAVLIIISIILSVLLVKTALLRTVVISILLFMIFELYGRFLGIKVVECYQHYATEETRRRCLCVPSCSEYAILCLKKFCLIKALVKIRKRLYVTCKGADYIIDWP